MEKLFGIDISHWQGDLLSLKLQEQMMASTRIASLKITMHSVRLSDFR